jgi:hypothetical protein
MQRVVTYGTGMYSTYVYVQYLRVCNGPTNALVCNKTLIQMPHTKTLKTLQHLSILSCSSSGSFFILVKITG